MDSEKRSMRTEHLSEMCVVFDFDYSVAVFVTIVTAVDHSKVTICRLRQGR